MNNTQMKTTIILCALLFSFSFGYAQNVIDPKYKKPELPSNASQIKSKAVFNKDLLISVYGKSQSDNVWDKCQAEYNAFNQNGDEVWIYEDEFFNGKKKILKVGDYTLKGSAKSHELGTDWNDKISSMLIPLSLKITLFMDDDFGGLKTEADGYGNYDRENGYSGFTGDYYTFRDLGKHTKGGLYFVGNGVNNQMINASDNISSLKIYK
ncbi:hypothetical protein SAMN04487898_10495 [Pedobacter sp. ok626]|uniref:hypothetical protein n=1 Tax=Pedobacter sp. ok626 TaxID=1761882 RepID=UPI000886740E|nr:hypothetical protein [Pedobacter sp. ok626]SDJ72284.1 hypothetical protein SAMN04487898_10495 [Pedobacter sp. ok626]